MKGKLPRILSAVVLALGAAAGFHCMWMAHNAFADIEAEEASVAAAAERKTSSREKGTPLFSLDEIFANVNVTAEDQRSHQVGMKLEVELFSDETRSLVEQRQGGMKHTIIQAAAEANYAELNTVGGKLYFKELLVARINDFFHRAVVRDLHFSSFYLQ